MRVELVVVEEKYQIAPQGVKRATEASMMESGVVMGWGCGVEGWIRWVERTVAVGWGSVDVAMEEVCGGEEG